MNRNMILVVVAIAAVLGLGIWFQAGGGAPAAGRMSPAPASLDFGKVFVGQTAKRPVAYTNNAAQAATVIGFGTNDAPFGAENNGFAAAVIQPTQKTLNMTFTFTPSDKGSFSGRGAVGVQPPGPKVDKVELKGEGVWTLSTAVLTIRPAAGSAENLDFGPVKVGDNKTLSVTLTNTSASDLIVQGIWGVNNAGITVSGPNPIVVPRNNGTVNVDIRFAPTEARDYLSAVVFLNPATPLNHAGIVVKGKGVQAG